MPLLRASGIEGHEDGPLRPPASHLPRRAPAPPLLKAAQAGGLHRHFEEGADRPIQFPKPPRTARVDVDGKGKDATPQGWAMARRGESVRSTTATSPILIPDSSICSIYAG